MTRNPYEPHSGAVAVLIARFCRATHRIALQCRDWRCTATSQCKEPRRWLTTTGGDRTACAWQFRAVRGLAKHRGARSCGDPLGMAQQCKEQNQGGCEADS